MRKRSAPSAVTSGMRLRAMVGLLSIEKEQVARSQKKKKKKKILTHEEDSVAPPEEIIVDKEVTDVVDRGESQEDLNSAAKAQNADGKRVIGFFFAC